MSDIFENKGIKPMLIGIEGEAFDSPDYLFELKLDGERCIAYLDENRTDLRNKRNIKLLPKVPELSEIHKQVNCRCILDGELSILKDGKPDFSEIQRRSLMTNSAKIDIASKKYPACFTAFDILYYIDRPTTDLPLTERKELLGKIISSETDRFAISRVIENNGIALYDLVKSMNLEGIVAKRKNSRYYFDKRTKDWIKCKYLKDEDFVICGYIPKYSGNSSIILGQYCNGILKNKGHVSIGVSNEAMKKIKSQKTILPSFQADDNSIVWIEPNLCCTVKYMTKTKSGNLRQPVFKGIRPDKLPTDCITTS
ncbi:MAG: DNA ligase [Firmicutes bacterium]|nr:DNA ligase [Bacillota bacterium]